jgi:hypothetical protein
MSSVSLVASRNIPSILHYATVAVLPFPILQGELPRTTSHLMWTWNEDTGARF